MSVSEVQDGALRKVRSVGDLPHSPETVHVHSSLRLSESTPESYDFDSNQSPRIRSVPSTAPPPTTSSLPPLQLDRNTIQPLPALPTQTTPPGHQSPPPQSHVALHVRVLSYFGLGRRATRARKSLVSLIWNLSSGFVQVCFRFISPSIDLKLGHIVRCNCLYAHSNGNPFQESF